MTVPDPQVPAPFTRPLQGFIGTMIQADQDSFGASFQISDSRSLGPFGDEPVVWIGPLLNSIRAFIEISPAQIPEFPAAFARVPYPPRYSG